MGDELPVTHHTSRVTAIDCNRRLDFSREWRFYIMIRGKEEWMIGVMGAIFLLLVLSCGSFAAEEGDIINGAPYLRVGAGARALAMGGASAAVAGDATATVWNVAGLSRVKATSVASMYSARDLLDRKNNFLALAQTVQNVGTFGVAWINSGVTGIERYSDTDVAQGTFDSSDNAFLLSYGAIFQPVRLGGGVKILSQRIDPDKDGNMGFGGLDIGILADPVEAVTVGLTIQNIFGKIADASVPVQLKLGTALRLLPEDNLLLAVDLDKAFVDLEDGTAILHMGAEYWAAKLIGFRLGVTSEKEFSAGIGINITGSDISLDYAYSIKRDGLEPDTHYVSICASF
jgi:hypothetical protein